MGRRDVFRTTTAEDEAAYTGLMNERCSCGHGKLFHKGGIGPCLVGFATNACGCVTFADPRKEAVMQPAPTMGQRAMRAAALLEGPDDVRNGLSRAQICKLFDIKRTALGEARYVLLHGAKEVVAAVLGGLLPVNTARTFVDSIALEAQADALPAVISTKGPSRIVRALGHAPPERPHPRHPSAKQIVKTIESLAVCANYLPDIINRGDLPQEQVPAWT
jgi:hypothetical protein